MTGQRQITPRRTLEPIVHCAQEVLSVLDDLTQAAHLIDAALKVLRPMAAAWGGPKRLIARA